MIYTEVFGIPKEGGELVFLGECKNSWRGAMWIWSHLAKKHLHAPDGWVLGNNGENCQMVYDLIIEFANPDEALSDTEYYALITTFDGVLVPNELMDVVADALDNFQPSTDNLKEQARLIRQAKEDGFQAVCWNQTSVCADTWRVWKDDEDGRLFNIDIDKDYNHWFMKERSWEPEPKLPEEKAFSLP